MMVCMICNYLLLHDLCICHLNIVDGHCWLGNRNGIEPMKVLVVIVKSPAPTLNIEHLT